MNNSIYITYNPDSEKEENLAMDLFRKGRQNGYFIYLPERKNSNNITKQTENNIDLADWFVVYATTPISETVRQEIEYAFRKKDPNHIIVIYSRDFGKNITFREKQPLEFYVDEYDLNSIEKFKEDLFQKINSTPKKQEKKGPGGLEVLLGIGVALLLLNAIMDNKEK